MKFPARLVCGALFAIACQAAVITTINGEITLAEPTMSTRVSRNGTPSDWSTAKAFPGVVSATVHYWTWDVAIDAIAPYLQISVDDPLNGVFVAAYWGTFTAPVSATNYMGDLGSTGNIFGNPATFQVVAPGAGTLVLMVANVLSDGSDLNRPFSMLIEGFTDSAYGEPAEVPEPATYALAASALLALVLLRRFMKITPAQEYTA